MDFWDNIHFAFEIKNTVVYNLDFFAHTDGIQSQIAFVFNRCTVFNIQIRNGNILTVSDMFKQIVSLKV